MILIVNYKAAVTTVDGEMKFVDGVINYSTAELKDYNIKCDILRKHFSAGTAVGTNNVELLEFTLKVVN